MRESGGAGQPAWRRWTTAGCWTSSAATNTTLPWFPLWVAAVLRAEGSKRRPQARFRAVCEGLFKRRRALLKRRTQWASRQRRRSSAKMSFWTVIPSQVTQEGVVFFSVEVGIQSLQGDRTRRIVQRRYREFRALQAQVSALDVHSSALQSSLSSPTSHLPVLQLKRELGDKKALPELPPKQPLSRVNEHSKLVDEVRVPTRRALRSVLCLSPAPALLVPQRRKALEAWLWRLMADVQVAHSTALSEFLELSAARRGEGRESSFRKRVNRFPLCFARVCTQAVPRHFHTGPRLVSRSFSSPEVACRRFRPPMLPSALPSSSNFRAARLHRACDYGLLRRAPLARAGLRHQQRRRRPRLAPAFHLQWRLALTRCRPLPHMYSRPSALCTSRSVARPVRGYPPTLLSPPPCSQRPAG